MDKREIIEKMRQNGGTRWAQHELNMTEEEVQTMLDEEGLTECGGCQRILPSTDVDENGLCKCRCAPCEYCD